jgi:hypothetical protein
MLRTLTRCSALAAAALMAVLTVTTVAQPASAATTTTNTWDTGGGIDLVLTTDETSDVFYDNIHAASAVCSQAINGALTAGVHFPDAARDDCASGTLTCVKEAVHAGRAIGAVRLYSNDDLTPRCLVR